MSVKADSIRALVLRMLGPAHDVAPEELVTLTDADWSLIQRMVRQHRLGPLLLERDKALEQTWPLPDVVREKWREDYRAATFAALRQERALHGIAATLARENIEVTALKGAWVAWHAYSHPALRPMRDIDILVPEDRALEARAALLADGYISNGRYTESPEEALKLRKHLPGIRSVDGTILIEIHIRLTDISGSPDRDAAADDDRDEQLRHRIIGMFGGHPVHYLSPSDTLLHLIVHSAFDHRMNNGPAIFDDIARILYGHIVDWPRFWMRAAKQQWTSGAELLLLLAERQNGQLPIQWVDGQKPEIPDAILTAASLLSLQDHQQRGVVAAAGKALMASKDRSGRGSLLRRLYAPSHQLAPLLGLKAGHPLAFAAYPIWLVRTGRKTFGGLREQATRDDMVKYAELSRWLGV
jgi:hypothetical protein